MPRRSGNSTPACQPVSLFVSLCACCQSVIHPTSQVRQRGGERESDGCKTEKADKMANRGSRRGGDCYKCRAAQTMRDQMKRQKSGGTRRSQWRRGVNSQRTAAPRSDDLRAGTEVGQRGEGREEDMDAYEPSHVDERPPDRVNVDGSSGRRAEGSIIALHCLEGKTDPMNPTQPNPTHQLLPASQSSANRNVAKEPRRDTRACSRYRQRKN
ncbi:uncharacterized protein J3D65DRAFT_137210 [Phyllosticta citribraziliensis]|uniref:Uncharacterized protein n=1 Tax=Phyllosticta citribraziliensis TaxID=989973 RepID=A0ABR1LAF3_9PEZI